MSKFLKSLSLVGLLSLSGTSLADDDLSQHWDGVWVAEGTLFTIAVEVVDGLMRVTKIETLGFEWTNEDGLVEGNIATVAVDYAGVQGTIQAQLLDTNTATAFAASCVPDFMVVCALAKGRSAIFRKMTPD